MSLEVFFTARALKSYLDRSGGGEKGLPILVGESYS